MTTVSAVNPISQPPPEIEPLACALCGAQGDLVRRGEWPLYLACRDAVACTVRFTVADHELGILSDRRALAMLSTCREVAADATLDLACRAITAIQRQANRRYTVTQLGRLTLVGEEAAG